MASYEDKILILIEAVDKTNQTLADIQKGLKGVKDGAKEASDATMGFGKLLGGITLGNVLSQAISGIKDSILSASHAVLKWSGDMETFGLSITSSLVTGGKYIDQTTGKALKTSEAFGIAREAAKGILQELQAANLQTIATLDQLTRVYVETLPIALQKGFNTGQVKDFTLAVVQAAGAIGLEMDMIAEETRAMLTPSINPRFSRVAVALGLTNEDIRQHSQNAETLFKFLMDKLEGFRLAGEMTQRTWRGLWSNLKDIALQAGAVVFEPLFVGIKNWIELTLAGVIRVNEETKRIEWNPEFLKTIESAKAYLTDLIILAKGLGNALKGVVFPSTAGELLFGKNTTPEQDLDTEKKVAEKNLAAAKGGGTQWQIVKTAWNAINMVSGGESFSDKDFIKYFEKQISDITKKQDFTSVTKATKALQDYEGLKKADRGQDSYNSYLKWAGDEFGIDPILLKAIMKKESDFNPKAINKTSGAMGLMQVMPENVSKTLAELVKSGKLRADYLSDFGGDKMSAAMDPWINTLMGTQIFSDFSKKNKGDLDKTLAGYGGFVTKDPTDYINKIKANKERFSGQDLMASSLLTYQGNEKMSKSDIEISKATYDEKVKLSTKHVQDEKVIIESGAKLKLAVLEGDHAAGLVSETNYYDKKNSITREKLQAEYDLVSKESDNVYNAFVEGLSANLTQPSEEAELGVFQGIFGDPAAIEKERTKVIVLMEGYKAEKIRLQNEMEIADVQQGTKKAQLGTKVAEINDQQATSYEKMANKIADETDRIKVSNNEMLPGDAMVAEHDRQVTAIENHLLRLSEIKYPEGSAEWQKQIDQLKELNMELELLAVKRPEVVKKGEIATTIKKSDQAKDIDEQRTAYYLLTGQMGLYEEMIKRTSISELQLKIDKAATEEEKAWMQAQLDFKKADLAYYEEYGPALSGVKDGLRDLGKEAGTTEQNFKDLTKGMGTAFSSALGKMTGDWLKFDGNFMKDLDDLKTYWKNLWGDLVNIFVDMLEKMLVKWILFGDGLKGSGLLGLFDGIGSGDGTTGSSGSGTNVTGGLAGLAIKKGLGYVWDSVTEYFAGTEFGKEVATYYSSLKESLGFAPTTPPSTGTSGYVGGPPVGGEPYTAGYEAGVEYGAESAAAYQAGVEYGSLAYEASPYYMGPAAEGATTVAEGTGAASGALSYAGPVVAAAVMAYQIYSAMQYNYAEPERAKAAFNYQKGSLADLGAGKGPMAGQSYQTQDKYVTGKIIGMMSLREDMEIGMTMEELDALVSKSLGPLNATLGVTSRAALDVGQTLGQGELKTQAYADSMEDLKNKMAASKDPLTFLNNALIINNEFATKTDKDGNGGIPDPTKGIPKLADAAEAIMFLSDVMGLTAEQTKYLQDAFKGLETNLAYIQDPTAIAEKNISKLSETLDIDKTAAEKLGQSLGLIPQEFEKLQFSSVGDAIKQLTETFKLPEDMAAALQDSLRMLYDDSGVAKFNNLDNLASILGINVDQAQRLKDKLNIDLQSGFKKLDTTVDGAAGSLFDAAGGVELMASSVDALSGSWVENVSTSTLARDSFLQLNQAQQLLAGGLQGDEPIQYAGLLNQLKESIEANGSAFLNQIPNIGAFIEILRALGLSIEGLPEGKDITIKTVYTQEGEPPPYGGLPGSYHSGGFVGRYHQGGLLKYHPWGGGIGGDEVPIIAQKGEYVLSRKDVEFIDKVKGVGHIQVNNIPALLPMINVVVNNQSSVQVQSAGAVRIDDDRYIIDVLLKDLHSNGRLRRALSF